MQKLKTIATISLLLLFLAGCSNSGSGAPRMQLKPEGEVGEITFGNGDESGLVVYSYHMGPFDLPAKNSVGKIPTKSSNFNFSVEDPVWINKFEPSIEDAEGNPLPEELVHQLILVNHAEENTFCTTKQTGNPFAAVTSNMERIELPEDHAYLLMPTDPLEASVTLKNPTGTDLFGVYIKFKLVGESVEDTKIVNDVKPMLIDIDPCEHKPISIAPGQYVEKTKDVFAPESGSVVKAYGLLQNYGVSVSLYANGETEPFWQGVAEIDENYEVETLKPFEDPAGVLLNRGDKLSLTVAYDNVSDQWYDSATGAAMVYLARSDDEEGESVPAANSEEDTSSETSGKNIGAKDSALATQAELLLTN